MLWGMSTNKQLFELDWDHLWVGGIRKDVGRLSKVNFPLPWYHKGVQLLHKVSSSKEHKNVYGRCGQCPQDIFRSPFGPSLCGQCPQLPLMPSYKQRRQGIIMFFPKEQQLFGQNQPLHLLANAKMQHGSLWSKIGFSLTSNISSNILTSLKYLYIVWIYWSTYMLPNWLSSSKVQNADNRRIFSMGLLSSIVKRKLSTELPSENGVLAWCYKWYRWVEYLGKLPWP